MPYDGFVLPLLEVYSITGAVFALTLDGAPTPWDLELSDSPWRYHDLFDQPFAALTLIGLALTSSPAPAGMVGIAQLNAGVKVPAIPAPAPLGLLAGALALLTAMGRRRARAAEG